jgi:V/A-type H+-transporting ATPase subunit A
MIRSLFRYTRVVSIVGDILTIRADGASFGELALVENALDDYVLYQKALLVDMVYLQQDAFDTVDVSTPLDRQKLSFDLVCRFTDRSHCFDDKEQARAFFTRVTNAFKNLNYSELDSEGFRSYLTDLERLADELR